MRVLLHIVRGIGIMIVISAIGGLMTSHGQHGLVSPEFVGAAIFYVVILDFIGVALFVWSNHKLGVMGPTPWTAALLYNGLFRVIAGVVGLIWVGNSLFWTLSYLLTDPIPLYGFGPAPGLFITWLFAYPGAWLINWAWLRSDLPMKAFMIVTLAIFAVELAWFLPKSLPLYKSDGGMGIFFADFTVQILASVFILLRFYWSWRQRRVPKDTFQEYIYPTKRTWRFR